MAKKVRRSSQLKRQDDFLAAYCEHSVIESACEQAGISRSCHYKWLREDPEYKARYEGAEQELVATIEAALDSRAIEGVEEPVFYNGEECGTKKRYSDTAAIFRLKALRPQKYRDNASVNFTGQMNVEHNGSIRVLEDANWFGNADRLSPETNGTPDTDPAQPEAIQNNGKRPPLGQNGNGHHSGT